MIFKIIIILLLLVIVYLLFLIGDAIQFNLSGIYYQNSKILDEIKEINKKL